MLFSAPLRAGAARQPGPMRRGWHALLGRRDSTSPPPLSPVSNSCTAVSQIPGSDLRIAASSWAAKSWTAPTLCRCSCSNADTAAVQSCGTHAGVQRRASAAHRPSAHDSWCARLKGGRTTKGAHDSRLSEPAGGSEGVGPDPATSPRASALPEAPSAPRARSWSWHADPGTAPTTAGVAARIARAPRPWRCTAACGASGRALVPRPPGMGARQADSARASAGPLARLGPSSRTPSVRARHRIGAALSVSAVPHPPNPSPSKPPFSATATPTPPHPAFQPDFQAGQGLVPAILDARQRLVALLLNRFHALGSGLRQALGSARRAHVRREAVQRVVTGDGERVAVEKRHSHPAP